MSEGKFDTHVWAPHPDYVWVPAERLKEGPVWEFKSVYGDTFTVPDAKCKELSKVSAISLKGGLSNLVALDEFGEGAVAHQLRERYSDNRIYTNIGTILVSVNPFKLLSIYSSKSIAEYHKDHVNAEPHVFQIAAEAYTSLLDNYRNQAVIISGESGAGKTEATKSVLQYLSEVAGSTSGVEQQILQSNPLLEAFGNAKTARNNNSSRFGKWMEVKFEAGGRIVASRIVNYLLEKSRVVQQGVDERNYHVFYQVCVGLKQSVKDDLHLRSDPSYYKYLKSSGVFEVPGMSDKLEFDAMANAMNLLNFEKPQIEQIWIIVASILNLGNLEFIPGKGDGSEIANQDQLEKVADNLKLEVRTLSTGLVFRSVTVRGSVSMIPLNPDLAADSRNALAKALYGKLFDWLVQRINKCLDIEPQAKLCIGILDIFGFEVFEKNYFEQICINYTNEKLQQHFNNYIFKEEQKEYKKEGIDVSQIEFTDNIECLNLIENKPVGLLAMFDEECSVPRGNDKSLIEKMHCVFADKQKHPFYGRIRKAPEVFIIKHYAGPVTYQVDGILAKNKDKIHDSLSLLVAKSGVELVQEIFTEPVESKKETPKKEGAPSNRRSRKGRGRSRSSGKKKKMKTLCGKFRSQLNQLYIALTAANPQYIRCIKPNNEKVPDKFDTAMSLRQMKYAGLFEAIRIRKSGYPFRGDYETFVRRYRVCLDKVKLKQVKEMTNLKDATKFIVNQFSSRLDVNELAFGDTKIFMRNSQRVMLGKIRDESLINHVLTLQAFGRAIGARRLYKKMKTLNSNCLEAIEKRVIENLNQCLIDADEQGIKLYILNEVKLLMNYLETEIRIAKIMEESVQGGDETDISVVTAALEEAKELDKEHPEEKHTDDYQNAMNNAKSLMERLIALDKARKSLVDAILKEIIQLLETALSDCKALGIGAEELRDGEELLEKLKYAEKVMQDLHIAVEAGNVDDIQKNLELTAGFSLDKNRQLDVAKAKAVMKNKYDDMVTLAVEGKDLEKLEEIMPKLTALGASYGDLARKGNNGIKKVYLGFCEECVESKNNERLENELIPKIRDELKFDDLEEQANQCLDTIYRAFCDNAINAKNVQVLDDLHAKLKELGLEGGASYAHECQRRVFDILTQDALEAEDTKELEENLIPMIKTHKFSTQLGNAYDRLKAIYIGFCKKAKIAKDNVQIEEKLIPKLKELGFEPEVAIANDLLQEIYIAFGNDALKTKDANTLEKELIPKLKRLDFQVALEKANDHLIKLYIAFCNEAQAAKDFKYLEGTLIPKIKQLKLDNVLTLAITCQRNIYTELCKDAKESNCEEKLVEELMPKIVELNFDDVLAQAENLLVEMYGSMIEEAEKIQNADKIETELIPKISQQHSEKFTFLIKKATNSLTKVYKDFVITAEKENDASKIEEELIPKIKELNLDIMNEIIASLEKIYSLILDGHIEAKREEKIKTEFIPKVSGLGLVNANARAQEYLDEQEALRKAEELRKKREEQRKKLEEEERKTQEELERKRQEEEARKKEEERRRKEEERKAEEARKEEERKKAEEERIRQEKEEEAKRLAHLKAEKEAAEKKLKEEQEAERKRFEEEEKKRKEREQQAERKRKAQNELLQRIKEAQRKKREKAEKERIRKEEEAEKKRLEEVQRKTAPLTFILPGPPPGLPPGATITRLPGPPPGKPPSAMQEMHESQKLDGELQMAIQTKDIDKLGNLLEKATMNTKTVRYARNLKMKLEDLRKISVEIAEAIDNIDIPKLKQLLNKGYQLGLTQNELVKSGRHLCYGLSTADQLTLKIKKAMSDRNLEKLSQYLDEAQTDFIDNEDVENARTFLAINSSREVWSSHKMRSFEDEDEDEDEDVQSEAYAKFIQYKGQVPISKCRLLRHEANYAKRKYLTEQASKSKRLQWQRDDIPRSLLKLSTAYCGNNRALSRHIKVIAKQLFKNIRGYMGDHYHPYPITLAYEVVNVGVNEPLLRDEIFTQMIKQTTLNPRPESTLLGMKLFYLCISTFAPSSVLTPYVMSHLAMFARQELPYEAAGFNTIEDLATNCWISYDLLVRTVGPGETGDPPSMQDIEQLTMGKLTPMNMGEVEYPNDEEEGFYDLPGPPDGMPPNIHRPPGGGPPKGDRPVVGPPPGLPPPPTGEPPTEF